MAGATLVMFIAGTLHYNVFKLCLPYLVGPSVGRSVENFCRKNVENLRKGDFMTD